MAKQDKVYVQGEGYQKVDPKTGSYIDKDKPAPPPPPPEKTHEEKTLILLNRIFRETRTTRKWVAFMGVVLLISILVSVIVFHLGVAAIAAGI